MGVSLVKVRKGWQCIIYMSGDDYNEAEAAADAATQAAVGRDAFWPGLYRGTSEWCEALYDHLAQWDYGEPTECEHDHPGRGYPDAVEMHGDYLLCWNTGLSSAALFVRVNCECE